MKSEHKNAIVADKIATVILYCIAGFFLLLLAGFTAYIIVKGIMAYQPGIFSFERTGIGVELFNTVYLVLISLIISVPIGVGAGIYMAEYAKAGKVTNYLRICIETLSSLPSIVIGLFGYLVFIYMTGSKYNLFAGALAVSILSLPLLTTVTEDAIRAVPSIYKEGSLAVGATHWQTIVQICLPVAMPRIITGIILAAGRGFGEAAALLYTAGMSSNVNPNIWNPFDPMSLLCPFRPGDTLALHIWALKTESMTPNADQIADFSAAVLLVLIFAFSLGSRILGARLDRKMSGK
ncbi:phosphate ABC transporter permease PstA [Acetobacterium paludosum]|uniref:Phosphate transport system permease protein PstA n=1 Tax=Acetobacterium paludosum TaxID=52693 RepID=A0A923I0T1_9FIRM|nr:phosphate ABC transporter permease PstA [Acetobacterium paludosum]MBC3889601.1 phosphate ABC transporter permease PstA [Acetobacterium paludosum]